MEGPVDTAARAARWLAKRLRVNLEKIRMEMVHIHFFGDR